MIIRGVPGREMGRGHPYHRYTVIGAPGLIMMPSCYGSGGPSVYIAITVFWWANQRRRYCLYRRDNHLLLYPNSLRSQDFRVHISAKHGQINRTTGESHQTRSVY